MKNKIILIAFLLVFLFFYYKYSTSSYSINYKIDDIKVLEKYNKNRFYFELNYDGKIFNFDLYKTRSLKKHLVKDIEVLKVDDYICLIPTIRNIETYPICRDKDNLVSYDLINNEELDNKVKTLKYKKYELNKETDFEYLENLDKNEYALIWKYNGFYLLNGNKTKEINIFKKDRYDNVLTTQINDKILMPNYDEAHIFTSFILLDITTGKYNKIETKYEIDYDSYIVGNYKNSVYLFDNKHVSLYEINTKTKKVHLIGNEEKGYIKIIDGKKKSAKKSEYVIDKIKVINTLEKDTFVTSNYFYYKENTKVISKFFEHEDIKIIYTNKDNIYFVYEDDLYKYNKLHGTKEILHYFELNFNYKTNVFVYNS